MVVDTANRLVFNVKPLPNGGISVNIGKGVYIQQAQLQKCIIAALKEDLHELSATTPESIEGGN